MRHLLKWLIVSVVCAGMAIPAAPAQAKVPGPNGQIVFQRIDRKLGGTAIYGMNPDGSHLRRLFARGAEFPHWSPDGRKVSIFCCDDGMAAHIIDADTDSFRELAPPDPTLEVHCGLWSPDAQRMACESYGITDPGRNGIYSIRTSDGGGLRRMTTNPGGSDTPGDYSPDGKGLVFVRQDPTGRVGLFVTKIDGSGLSDVPTPGLILEFGFFAASWSPTENKILLVARPAPDHHRAIWVVNADGSGLHQLPIAPSCGGALADPRSISCFDPGWSPDGTKIVFTGVTANGTQSNIYTVNADGSGRFQVTHGLTDSLPDWGRHTLATKPGIRSGAVRSTTGDEGSCLRRWAVVCWPDTERITLAS